MMKLPILLCAEKAEPQKDEITLTKVKANSNVKQIHKQKSV